jgi:hypothetical protein
MLRCFSARLLVDRIALLPPEAMKANPSPEYSTDNRMREYCAPPSEPLSQYYGNVLKKNNT